MIQRPVDRRAVLVESVASELMFGAVIPALRFRSSQSFLVASRLSHLFACEPCAPVDRSAHPQLRAFFVHDSRNFSVEYSRVYIYIFIYWQDLSVSSLYIVSFSHAANTTQKWKAKRLREDAKYPPTNL